MKRLLSSAVAAMLTAAAMAGPKIELVLNNAGTFLPAEVTANEQTEYNLGIALSEDGIANAVAVDAADAIATISGKYWNDHGSTGVILTMHVDGPVLVTAGGCTYSGNEVTITDAEGNSSSFKCEAGCWKNDHSKLGKGYYTGGATTLTIKGHQYMPYLSIEELDELPSTVSISYNVDDSSVIGSAPAAQDVEFQSDYAIPANRTLYKEGYTLTGWNDGKNTYAPGTVIKPETNLVLTPVFKANGNVITSRKNEVTVCWDFQRNNGAPTLAAQGAGKNFYYVAQASVDGETQDVAMYCDVEGGKIANGNWGDWAQINAGTKLTIISGKDATVTLESYNATTTTTFNGHAAEGNAEKIYTYTEAGDVNACEIIIGDGSYFRTFTTVLPANYVAPSGDSYDNTTVSFLWAQGNERDPQVSDDLNNVLTSSEVTVGTDLEVSGPKSYSFAAEGAVGPFMVYRPNTGNPGCVPTDMVEYSVKLKKGLTLTPTSFVFDIVKEGTDNAYISWSYTVDGVESEIKAYSDPKNQIRRNNDANPSAPLTHNETVASEGGRVVTLRFYISNVANNKTIAIGNVKINGRVNGEVEVRSFQNFKVDFRNADGMVVTEPASGVLPQGVEITGSFHDGQHGNNQTTIVVPCDGPVKFTFGSCQYGSTGATIKGEDGEVMATIDCNVGCDDNTSCDHFVTWYYNSEVPQTLTITTASYIPFFYAEACELLPMFTVSYYDTDGKTLLGKESIQGGSALAYIYGEADVTVAEGQKFRGWFNSTQSTAVKVFEGTMVQDDLKLYAKATQIEVPTNTSRYIYDLTKQSFYVEDHEAIEIDGKYYNNHGWLVNAGGSIRVLVAGKAYVSVGNCLYSSESTATVTGEDGVQYATFPVKAEADGAETTFRYDGPAQWLSITFPNGSYTHSVKVSNVVDFVQFSEESGFYTISAGDVSSFLIALADANSRGNVKIFLPNGTYDLGETVLTPISGKNISIIGESMEGTIIRNQPPKENEGIGTTATLYNTSDGLYMQDLTIQNALDYYATGAAGRAVCLQDKGKNTICKNVRMLSYQDTYYSNAASRFYWEDSEIHGTVDYLCGDGDVVYNRCKFVNESRNNGKKEGSDVVAAPYTSANMKWGYVFLDCAIESACKDFTFARSWGGESKAQYIRTTVLDGSLNAARFTAAGMNVAAYKFKEYKTMDAEGNVISPESNVMNFTHSSGNKTYETILTDEEAAQYTIENIYGEWAPDVTCQQVEITADMIPALGEYVNEVLCTLSGHEEEGSFSFNILGIAYEVPDMIQIVDEFVEFLKQTEGLVDYSITLRAANSRGGFGPAFDLRAYLESIVSIEQVEAQPAAPSVSYNLFGQPVKADAKGISIINGQKVIK